MKNKFKRFLSIALVLVMIFAMFPLAASAADNVLTIEAETGVISNGAGLVSNGEASAGQHVGNIGGGTDGTVTFTVTSPAAGPATLNLYYIQSDTRQFEVDVNGTVLTVNTPSSGSWTIPAATPVSVSVKLNSGNNTIAISGVGTAYAPNLDKLEVILPSVARYEMEKGTTAGGAAAEANTNASAGSFVHSVGGANGANGTITHEISVASAGPATITVGYGQNDTRDLVVTINGTNYTLLDCPSSGGWYTFTGTASVDVQLKAGSNTIIFGGNNGYAPNLDYFEIATAGSLVANATLVADDITVQAGSVAKVPVYLKDAANLSQISGSDGTLAGVQFKVSTSLALTLTGFEAGSLFTSFDWATEGSRVLGFAPLNVSGVALDRITDDTVIGYLVFSTTSDFKTTEVSIEAEGFCDNAGNGSAVDYTNNIDAESFTVAKEAEKAVLTGGDISVEAGAVTKVPVYLTNADALLDVANTDGTLGGLQFDVMYSKALALTGFEFSDLFKGYDVVTKAYNGENRAKVIISNSVMGANSRESVEISKIRDDTVIGYLVFNTGSDFATTDVTIDFEDACDEQGNTYPADAIVTKSFTITKTESAKWDISFSNMTLGNNLAMSFAFAANNEADWSGHYVEIVKTYADGRDDVVKTVAFEDWTSSSINSVAHYSVTFDGVAAKEMSDNVYVTVYNADGVAVSNVYTMSVRAYAMKQLAAGKSDELNTTIVDMLNYGAASQKYLGYNLNDLANNQLTDAQKAMATESVSCTNSSVGSSNYRGTNLKVESSILLQMAFSNVDQNMRAVISFTDHYGRKQTIDVAGSEFEKVGNYYVVTVDELVVADGRQLVTVQVYNGNTLVAEASDSMEGYCARAIERGGTNAEVFEMLMKFSDSAYAFFHN